MSDNYFKNGTICIGDNLKFMKVMPSGFIDLIYLDPPFNSNANYSGISGSKSDGAEFKDTWRFDDIDFNWLKNINDSHKDLYEIIISTKNICNESMTAYLTYMAIRLMEMKRILKNTGSIYLHCDPHASHYLKMIMDAVFGGSNFRNEIIWNLNSPSGYKTQAKRFVRAHDVVLYYTKSDNFIFNKEYLPYKDSYISTFNKEDEDGRKYKVRKRGEKHTRQYLDESKGISVTDVWSDILSFQNNPHAKELIGYPTQKPLSLLNRIIMASSNEGDMVLDPFCGSGTTCFSAEVLDRQWIGIDASEKAVTLMQNRMVEEFGDTIQVHIKT